MSNTKELAFSVVVPAFNEETGIAETIQRLQKTLPTMSTKWEIIIVDDGSSDQTAHIVQQFPGVVLIQHPTNGGYGLSLKDGIRRATYEYIIITDADGTYPIYDLPRLAEYIPTFDMVVGSRTGKFYRGTFLKYPARKIFLWLSEFATGRRIDDINSGLRIFRRDLVLGFFDTLSQGFSFTTTITLAFMLNGHFVKYIPIDYQKRLGKSHIRYFRDTLRSAQIIVQAILYYNPIKIFLLLSLPAIFFTIVTLILGFAMHEVLFYITSIFCFLFSIIMFSLGLLTDMLRKSFQKK